MKNFYRCCCKRLETEKRFSDVIKICTLPFHSFGDPYCKLAVNGKYAK